MSEPPTGPRPDILTHVELASKVVDFSGAHVLEIGGDRWDASANYMIERGASHVTIINIASHWKDREELTPQITKVRVSANELASVFAAGHFDFVLGIAVLEHIPQSWLMLNDISTVLARGGCAYLHGGPLWTSNKGHHLFTKVNDRFFRFQDKDCPVGDWEHLMLGESELAERIQGRGQDADTAAQLAHYVHTTQGQNHYGYERLARIFDRSPLDVVERVDSRSKAPPKDVLEGIRRSPWGDEGSFDVFGVTYVLQNGSIGPGRLRPRRFGRRA